MYPRPESVYSESSPVFTTAASLEDLLEHDRLLSSLLSRGQMATSNDNGTDDDGDDYWTGLFLPTADAARRFTMYNMADFDLRSAPNADADNLSCPGTRTPSLCFSTVSFDVLHAATHAISEPKPERRSKSLYERLSTFWKTVQGRFINNNTAA